MLKFVSVLSIMPISKKQLENDGNTKKLEYSWTTQIRFAQENPKKPGSKAWAPYEAYKASTTIAQAIEKKAGWQDFSADFAQGCARYPKNHNRRWMWRDKVPPKGQPQ